MTIIIIIIRSSNCLSVTHFINTGMQLYLNFSLRRKSVVDDVSNETRIE